MNLDDAAHELYGLPPEEFTDARNTRAKAIAGDGDRELADQVRKLPKPTVTAWLANLLVRQRGPEVRELIALGVHVREAHLRGARHDIRQVADRRRRLIGKLVEGASTSATASGHSVGPQVQRLLEETLEAAVVDEGSAVALQEGRLAAPLHFIGFGGLASTESSIEQPSARKQERKPKAISSEVRDATQERQAAEQAVADAERSLANAREALDSAVAAVEETRGRHVAASDRCRAAVKEVKDAERGRARTAERLERARQSRTDSERILKAAERERKRRLAHLDSVVKGRQKF